MSIKKILIWLPAIDYIWLFKAGWGRVIRAKL